MPVVCVSQTMAAGGNVRHANFRSQTRFEKPERYELLALFFEDAVAYDRAGRCAQRRSTGRLRPLPQDQMSMADHRSRMKDVFARMPDGSKTPKTTSRKDRRAARAVGTKVFKRA